MAIFELLINGSLVLASPGAASSPSGSRAVSIERFSRAYDEPSNLALRVDGDWRWSPYSPDSVAVLYRDGACVFEGLLDAPRPVASLDTYPAVRYTAYDRTRALDGPVVLDGGGNASIPLDGGKLSDVVDEYLEFVAATLTEKGVSDTVVFAGGAGNIETLPVTLDATSVDAGLRRIAEAAPGVRVLLLPDAAGGLPTYTFVNLFGSSAYDLVMDAQYVRELDIYQSFEGRAGAVKTLEGSTRGSADVELEESRTLVPAWDSLLEATWTFAEPYTYDDAGKTLDYAAVYRKFSFAAFADELRSDMPMAVHAKIVPDDVNPRWMRLAITKIDWEAKTLTLDLPAIRSLGAFRTGFYNPKDPGRAKPAVCKLRFTRSGSASTPIIIGSARHPATGYAGRAYQMAPVTCGYERIIQVPAGVDRQAYAQDAHAAYSEPVTVGSIPIDGELVADLWRLDRRINITTDSHGETGFEALGAPLMGVEVAFGGGESATLALEKDPSILLRKGS